MDQETTNFFKSLRVIDPENLQCADCDAHQPQWTSLTHGTFICMTCSGIHRGMGVHISFVRSTTMDSWNARQKTMMSIGGNASCKTYFIQHGIDKLPLKEKYATVAASDYRNILRAKLEGRPAPTPTATADTGEGRNPADTAVASNRAASGGAQSTGNYTSTGFGSSHYSNGSGGLGSASSSGFGSMQANMGSAPPQDDGPWGYSTMTSWTGAAIGALTERANTLQQTVQNRGLVETMSTAYQSGVSWIGEQAATVAQNQEGPDSMWNKAQETVGAVGNKFYEGVEAASSWLDQQADGVDNEKHYLSTLSTGSMLGFGGGGAPSTGNNGFGSGNNMYATNGIPPHTNNNSSAANNSAAGPPGANTINSGGMHTGTGGMHTGVSGDILSGTDQDSILPTANAAPANTTDANDWLKDDSWDGGNFKKSGAFK